MDKLNDSIDGLERLVRLLRDLAAESRMVPQTKRVVPLASELYTAVWLTWPQDRPPEHDGNRVTRYPRGCRPVTRVSVQTDDSLRTSGGVQCLPDKTLDRAVSDRMQIQTLCMDIIDHRTGDADQLELLAKRLENCETEPKDGKQLAAVDLIDCQTAAEIWMRGPSWWRQRVGEGKPIPLDSTRGNKAKLFAKSDAGALAKKLSIDRRPSTASQ